MEKNPYLEIEFNAFLEFYIDDKCVDEFSFNWDNPIGTQTAVRKILEHLKKGEEIGKPMPIHEVRISHAREFEVVTERQALKRGWLLPGQYEIGKLDESFLEADGTKAYTVKIIPKG